MADAGDIVARLLLDAKQWMQGMQDAEKETSDAAQNINGQLTSITNGLSSIGAALGGLAIAEGMKTFAEDALSASADIGKFRTQIIQLKGDGEETRAFLEQIHELAATSPFAFPELAQASEKMVQLGGSLEQVTSTMTAITQMGTALKMSGEQVTTISNAMARLAAGADPIKTMNQLVREGVPAWQMLAEQLGTNMSDAQAKVKAGAIDSNTVLQALTTSMSSYAGAASGYSDTWKGAMKGLQDETHAAMAVVGDDIKAALNEVAAPALKAVTQLVKDAAEIWKGLPDPVKDAALAFGAVITAAGALAPVIIGLGTVIGAISGPVAIAVAAIAGVVAALVALAAWVNEHWAGVSNILTNAWSGLQEIWGGTWKAIVSDVTSTWNDFISDTKTEFNDIVDFVGGVWNAVTGIWTAVWQGIIGAVEFAWNTLKGELKIFDEIMDFLFPFWDPIKQVFLGVWNEIVTAIDTAWGKIKGILQDTGALSLFTKLGETFGIVKQAAGALGDEMGKTSGVVKDAGDSVKTTTGHLNDNTDSLKKTKTAAKEVEDQFKATKDKTELLWKESQILTSEHQKLATQVATNRLEEEKMAAAHQTLADKVTAIIPPVQDLTKDTVALGNAAQKTMQQINDEATVVGAAETALKNLGIQSTRTTQAKAEQAEADQKAIANAGDMMSAYDNLAAKEVTLKAQIEALTKADGDHKDKLGELQQALTDTQKKIHDMTTSAADDYHEMGLNTAEDIQKMMDKDQERADAAWQLVTNDQTGSPAIVRQWQNAELQILKDKTQNGIDLTSAEGQNMANLEAEVKKGHDAMYQAWTGFNKSVTTDVGNAFDGIIDKLITGKGSFSELMTTLWQGLAKDCAELFLAPLKTGIEDFIKTTLGDLMGSKGLGGVSDALSSLGGKIKGLFSSSASSVGDAAEEAASSAEEAAGSAAQAGGSAASSAGSLLSSIGSIANIANLGVNIASGIVSGMQQAHMSSDLQKIEESTRYMKIGLVTQSDSLLNDVHMIRNMLSDQKGFMWDVLGTYLYNINVDLDEMLEAVKGILTNTQVVADATPIIEQAVVDGFGSITKGLENLTITVTATGVTTVEAAKALGNQIAVNLSHQLVPTAP